MRSLGIVAAVVVGLSIVSPSSAGASTTVSAPIVKCSDATQPYPIVVWQVTNSGTTNETVTVTMVTGGLGTLISASALPGSSALTGTIMPGAIWTTEQWWPSGTILTSSTITVSDGTITQSATATLPAPCVMQPPPLPAPPVVTAPPATTTQVPVPAPVIAPTPPPTTIPVIPPPVVTPPVVPPPVVVTVVLTSAPVPVTPPRTIPKHHKRHHHKPKPKPKPTTYKGPTACVNGICLPVFICKGANCGRG